MRSRKKRIAVFLVVALFIGIACPYNQREIKEMKAVENNVSYKDGDEIQPLFYDTPDSSEAHNPPDKTRW